MRALKPRWAGRLLVGCPSLRGFHRTVFICYQVHVWLSALPFSMLTAQKLWWRSLEPCTLVRFGLHPGKEGSHCHNHSYSRYSLFRWRILAPYKAEETQVWPFSVATRMCGGKVALALAVLLSRQYCLQTTLALKIR